MVVDGRLGVLADERFHPAPVPGPDPLRRALEEGLDLRALGRDALGAPPLPLIPDSLDPPVANPSKVIAIGLNYRDHCREAGMPEPESPVVFSKHPSSVVGAGHPIPIDPQISSQVDYEVELAVIIGRRCRDLTPNTALEAVAGYTVCNDISARDLQLVEGQWVRAKSFDGFCPTGPVMVTPDEIGDPQTLGLQTVVSGERLQDSSTGEMIFSVAELLPHVSRGTTLNAGDLLLTGTPWGSGAFRDPPRYLRPGDTVTCSINAIGTLSNPVVAVEPVPLDARSA